MELRFNVIKDERKALVTAISEITDYPSKYCGAPGFAFAVGGYTISKDGTVSFEEEQDADKLADLLAQLAGRGFVYEKGPGEDFVNVETIEMAASVNADNCETVIEPDETNIVNENTDYLESAPESGAGEEGVDCRSDAEESENIPCDGGKERSSDNPDGTGIPVSDGNQILALSIPLSGITDVEIVNLEKLVASKAWIIKKMIGADILPIERLEDRLNFPWFKTESTAEEVAAYSFLIAQLCNTAKLKKRIVAEERPPQEGDNEKFKARCMLLALGFIGNQYAKARKILLAPMSGNGSFKSGNHKKATTVPESAASAQNTGNTAIPTKCSECWHHCYYTGGLLRTKAGDIVDTSNRTPDPYTHYCLETPSGFRKIKHDADWSGSETAPNWCRQYAEQHHGDGV